MSQNPLTIDPDPNNFLKRKFEPFEVQVKVQVLPVGPKSSSTV